MRYITFQFCAFTSLVGALIDWATHGDINHVDIVLPDGHPRAGDLLGAHYNDGLGGAPSGVQIRAADYGDSCGMVNRKRVSLPTSDDVAEVAYAWALNRVGTPYDLRDIAGIVCDVDWARPTRLICSGLATGMLTQPSPAFIDHPLIKPWRIVTPEELAVLCSGFAPVVPVL
jgi:hypothetical protein